MVTTNLKGRDLICTQDWSVDELEATLELARSVDMMLVIGGRGSSNTRGLYQMCVEHGIPVRFIETADEIAPSWFDACSSVGLTTGTSTPDWIIDEVVERMEDIAESR